MIRFFFTTLLTLSLLHPILEAQPCALTAVTATPLACEGNNFAVSLDLEISNPASDSFKIAGNGLIYGTYAYTDLPVTVGSLYGDNESEYEFIVWDKEDGSCQDYTLMDAADCGPICSISNFELEFVACVSNISAIVVFDFDYENPSGPTFDLIDEDGEILSTWLYTSLPVTIPFFEVNGAAPIVLTVSDHNDPSCSETFVMDAIDCNPNNCEIFSVSIDPQCTGSNFLVNLVFGYDNPPSDSFSVAGNNINYGTFAYTELPVSLGPLNGNTNIQWEFNIEDSESADCNNTGLLGVYKCPPPCDMLALEALALECNGNEAFALQLGLDIEGEGDLGFAVFSETAYYGSYMYNELPLTIPAFEGSGEFIDYVSVCDNEKLNCCATTPFEALLCAGCLIYNLEANPLPCNMDDEIFIQIDFDFQNVSSEGFEITGNGDNYGEFSYDDLPVLVGPFAGDGSQYFEFVVTDLVNTLCFEAVELGFIDCDTICELSNLTVEIGDCNGNDQYVAVIDFDYQGVSGVGFDLIINGEAYGFYDYDDLPLTIEEFPSSGSGVDVITVCENGNDFCCATLEFDAPDCACVIFDTNAEVLECNTDSTFQVSVEFFHENLPGNSVDVFLDGVFIGFYSVNDIPLLIELPEGDGTGVLTVCANDLGDCCDEVIIEMVTCEPPMCGLFELQAETGDCASDSTYLLDFVFETINTDQDSILVYANGELVGQYLIHPDFNRIENFPALATDTTTLTVCILGEPDCCDTYSFETPDCSTFGQCNIWDLIAEVAECSSDSTYALHVDFNSENLPVDSVIITANGNYIGQYQVTSEFILIEHFPVLDSTLTTIIVCAVGTPDCCEEYQFETPDCSTFGQCNIWDLIAEVADCSSDSTFALHVDFNSQNLPVDSVIITANGNYIGQYQVSSEFILVEHFPVFDSTLTTIIVCAVGAPDCCVEFQFETPNCEGTEVCNIFDLVADTDVCNGDSSYGLLIVYSANFLPTDSVIVTSSVGFSGTFLHSPDGITIDSFPAGNTSHTTITVCAQGDESCCDTYIFLTPDCGQEFICEIYELFAETGDCASDSTYLLDIVFEGYSMPSDSVLVYASDELVGTYFNHPDFIRIDNFPWLDGEETTITVCAQGDEECCASYTFETPNCGGGDCSITDFVATVFDCNSDSTFLVVVNFDHENFPGGGFDMYAGDTYLGFYTFDQLPAELNNFPSNDFGEYTITICESDGTKCCSSWSFFGPTCGTSSCSIFDLEYTLTECDSADNFYFILDFDFANVGNDGFNVTGNGNNYGNFSYDSLPVYIGPFQTDDTIYEFIVSDNTQPDCSDIIEPGIVNCFVSTAPIDFDEFFAIFNNGSIPGIYAKKDLTFSLFNSSGKNVLYQFPLSADAYFELINQPSGLYIGIVKHNHESWPLKLVKSGK